MRVRNFRLLVRVPVQTKRGANSVGPLVETGGEEILHECARTTERGRVWFDVNSIFSIKLGKY